MMAHDHDHNIYQFFGTERCGDMHAMYLAIPMFADLVNDVLGSDGDGSGKLCWETLPSMHWPRGAPVAILASSRCVIR